MPSPLFFDADIGATLSFVIKDAEGVAYNLTSATVTLLVQDLGDFTCTITDATAGEAEYVVLSGDFPKGTHRAQIKVEKSGDTLHSTVFNLNVSEVVDSASVPAPNINPSEGAIPFGGLGGGFYTEDPPNLNFDDVNNNLRLFGGTVGASGSKVLALGIVATAPTTSPVDTVQLVVTDFGAEAGSASLNIRDERSSLHTLFGHSTGSGYQVSRGSDTGGIYIDTTGDTTVGSATKAVKFYANNVVRLTLDVNGNAGLGTSTFGTNAAKVLGLFSGTAPTTSPADLVQIWTADRNGAGTADLRVLTEEGHSASLLGWTLAGKDDTERTTTSLSSVDLSTIPVNIPVGDLFLISGRIRKTGGHASACSIGLKLNGTQIWANVAFTSAVAQVEDGSFMTEIGLGLTPIGITNYLHGLARGLIGQTCVSSTHVLTAIYTSGTAINSFPTAAITEVIITGQVANASNTLAIDDVRVYRLTGF